MPDIEHSIAAVQIRLLERLAVTTPFPYDVIKGTYMLTRSIDKTIQVLCECQENAVEPTIALCKKIDPIEILLDVILKELEDLK